MIRLNSDSNSGVDEMINPIMSHIPVSTAHVNEHTLNLSIFYYVLIFTSGETEHLQRTYCTCSVKANTGKSLSKRTFSSLFAQCLVSCKAHIR